MTEYAGDGTIIAAQLDYAGFKAEPDKWWCCDGDEWTLQDAGAEKWRICAARHPTYRADTLLAWLLARGTIGYIMSIVPGTITVTYNVLDVPAGPFKETAETLPDALGEVILEILDYPPDRHPSRLP